MVPRAVASRAGVERLYLVCDPLVSPYGSRRPPILLAREFVKRYEVVFVSGSVSRGVREVVEGLGASVLSLNAPTLSGPFSTLVSWCDWRFIEARGGLVINFSQNILVPSHAYYAQGPMWVALRDIARGHRMTRVVEPLATMVARARDSVLVRWFSKHSRLVVANSKWTASAYARMGVDVRHVIYPPLDLRLFKPTTNKPSEGYAVCYLGKETDFKAVLMVANAGVRLVCFGPRTLLEPPGINRHPMITRVGGLSEEELARLYSNALFTLFPFNHEPFGYVVAESLACGTPVVTYGRQGPLEMVREGVNGWLASSRDELVEKSRIVWRRGYPRAVRRRSRESANRFSYETVANEWARALGLGG